MDTIQESLDTKITKYLKEALGETDFDIDSMNLPEKMSIVEFRDKEKWNEFKIGLRESGYII